MALRSEILTEQHDCLNFYSGEESLDRWLAQFALESQRKGTGRTFVIIDEELPAQRVLAYYTLSAHIIDREQLPRKLGRGMPSQLPCLLLGRLALASTHQGKGFGGLVLSETIDRARNVASQVGVRYLVVDALSEKASGFYQHFGFIPLPSQFTPRLVLRIRPPGE